MNDQANPVLVMIAAILMVTVTFVYVLERSTDSYHLSMLPAATSPAPF
jgi:hypothetical protein